MTEPQREGRSNVSNPILKIVDFQSGSIPTESQKRDRHPLGVPFMVLMIREFAPPYKASDAEAAEQCFEPMHRRALR